MTINMELALRVQAAEDEYSTKPMVIRHARTAYYLPRRQIALGVAA